VKILFLDDDSARHHAFSKLADGHVVDYVWTADEAIAALAASTYDLVCLDHDLGGRVYVDILDEEGTGYTVALAMEGMPEDRRPRETIVHSFNPEGARRIADRLGKAGFRVIKAPFGTFSLPPAKESA
jgi:CheY-like chemotaxis protein